MFNLEILYLKKVDLDLATSILLCKQLFHLCDYLLICFVAFCVSMKKPSGPEVSCSFSKYNGAAAQDPAPIISVPTQSRASPSLVRTCSQDSTAETDTASTSFTDQPIFFRCVRGSSIHNHLQQGCPILLREGYCPLEFSSASDVFN